jgi:hypothetical protein
MCCGRERMKSMAEAQSRQNANLPPVPAPPGGKVRFEYAGSTGLTVTGPVSGSRYRFEHPGAIVEVDARDRILLASLRQLRQIRT